MKSFGWNNTQQFNPRTYTCKYCGTVVSSNRGWNGITQPPAGQPAVEVGIYLCPKCTAPTFFDGEGQIPDVAPGGEVRSLPGDIDSLYREARNCCAASAYTGSVLCSRKLLMNIAVSQGDQPGRTFIEHIEFLASKGFVPPHGKGWVDHIRKKGNEATHQIHMMSRQDAEELLVFIEMLLKFIYEFPARVPPPSP